MSDLTLITSPEVDSADLKPKKFLIICSISSDLEIKPPDYILRYRIFTFDTSDLDITNTSDLDITSTSELDITNTISDLDYNNTSDLDITSTSDLDSTSDLYKDNFITRFYA